jgi:hypothetical protein
MKEIVKCNCEIKKNTARFEVMKVSPELQIPVFWIQYIQLKTQVEFPGSSCLSFFHQPRAINNGLLLITYAIQLVIDLDKSMKYKCTVWNIGN